MKRLAYILTITFFALMISTSSMAQVGIKNNSPKSVIDISASDSSAPAITDGLLVPRIDAFSTTDPGTDQDGMIVFLNNNTQPNFKKRHHYWDNAQLKVVTFWR